MSNVLEHFKQAQEINKCVIPASLGGWAGIALVLALSTTGCATPPKETSATLSNGTSDSAPKQTVGTEPLTPVEQRMRAQSQAFDKTVWEGALIGGASTSLLMAVLSGQELAMLGGGAGAAAGGLAGSYVANKQKQYSNKEDVLNSMTADVRQSNADSRALIASVRAVIDEDKRRLAAVQQQVQSGQATQAALAAERRRIAENKAVMKQASQGAREKQAMFQDAERQFRAENPGTDTAPMQQQLSAFNQNIDTLDGLAQSISAA